MTDEIPKCRRWSQFRLRTLLIAVLVLSLPLSWFAVRMEKARRQKEAVDVIDRAGVYVFHYRDLEDALRRLNEPPPEWASAILGDDFFTKVIVVKSHVDGFGDDDMAFLKDLPYLEVLLLTGPQVTDAGLEHLKGLTTLETLDLSETQVTSEGVKKLQRALPNCNVDY